MKLSKTHVWLIIYYFLKLQIKLSLERVWRSGNCTIKTGYSELKIVFKTEFFTFKNKKREIEPKTFKTYKVNSITIQTTNILDQDDNKTTNLSTDSKLSIRIHQSIGNVNKKI